MEKEQRVSIPMPPRQRPTQHSTTPQHAVSFGALVHLIRVAARRDERRVTRELFVLLLERIEGHNRRWADQTARGTAGLRGPTGLAAREDLRQELTLRLWESIALASGESWELFFQRSLAYAQRHTATAYMEQHGYWSRRTASRRAVSSPATLAAGDPTRATYAPVAAEDLLEQRHSNGSIVALGISTRHTPDMAAIGGEFAASDLTDLRDLVARLPQEQRIAIVLRHWQQAFEIEIAETLGLTTRTVRNYLRRAHMRLREWYEGTGALACAGMSDMKQTKRRSNATKRESQAPTRDVMRQLELQAIEDQFLSEWRANLRPQLSTYLRRYPNFSTELAAFVALTFIPSGQSGVLLLAGDDVPAHEHRVALSSGARQALEDIFGADGGEAASWQSSRQSRVAERHAGYGRMDAPTPPAKDENPQDRG